MAQQKGDSTTLAGIVSYATPRELAAAVFRRCDVAEIARSLLENGAAKGASVRLRMWEKLVELYFGKPASAPKRGEEKPEVEIIWDILPNMTQEPQ